MKFYDLTVPQLTRMLGNIDRWLDRAAAHEQAEQLLTARLASDQYALTRQVQVSSDNAKLMCARLTGKQAPSHPDTETTYAQLKARIASVADYLGSYTVDDFADTSDRKITLPWMQPGQWLTAEDY